jgi:hypothetical protein
MGVTTRGKNCNDTLTGSLMMTIKKLKSYKNTHAEAWREILGGVDFRHH